jgi:hypothetical protein
MIKILAIDGGGIRGVIPATVLAYLEKQMGKPCREVFDYMVGTSTGGMLSLALSRKNALSADAMWGVYREYGPQIFHRGFTWSLRSLGNLNGPKYDVAALTRCAEACLGTDKLGDAATHAMVTSYDLKARAPQFFSSYATPTISMVDAALSTSAAPTYFTPHGSYVDGGVCDNNPALSGVIEACKIEGCTVRDVLVLSLGTGSDMVAYDGKAASWGLLSWAQKLPSIFMDGTSGLHEYHLRRLLPNENVLRLQCQVDGPLAEMDNASDSNLTALHTAGYLLATQQRKLLDDFMGRLA